MRRDNMKKFKVVLSETRIYNIEVTAATEDEALELAFADEKFTNSCSDDIDTTWDIDELIEEDDK
jgi:hypothetical protein